MFVAALGVIMQTPVICTVSIAKRRLFKKQMAKLQLKYVIDVQSS